ncbi:MAG: zf-HC2 domain-containing protein [Gemmatimonadota bacterium]|nr:zf-HC2 domain-containing protein [Gemmatimonadota bacterium]
MSECTNGAMRDLLPELVNGRLDAMTQLAVDAHVAECEECAEELELLRVLRPALLRGPVVNAERIAAAVRAQVPAQRGANRRGMSRRLAIAAAALLAVSAIGYAIAVRGLTVTPEVAVVQMPRTVTTDSADTAMVAAPTPEHPTAPPAPRTVAARAPEQQVAVAAPHSDTSTTATTTVASVGVLDNLSDLSDDDVRALTASLDGMSSLPDADPSPDVDPLGATIDDQSGGGAR